MKTILTHIHGILQYNFTPEVTSPLEKIHFVSIFHFRPFSLWFLFPLKNNISIEAMFYERKVIFEMLRIGSHDEKEATLVEL